MSCLCINDSILSTTKKLIGVDPECTHFDPDLIVHINTVFSILSQLGCGPCDGFMIDDDTPTWAEYLEDNQLLNLVQSYMALKVKLLFDPPSSSFVLNSIQSQISELEWRINVQVDPHKEIVPTNQPAPDLTPEAEEWLEYDFYE